MSGSFTLQAKKLLFVSVFRGFGEPSEFAVSGVCRFRYGRTSDPMRQSQIADKV